MQQERSLVPLVMPYSHGYSIKQIEHLTDQQICNAINHFFLFCESIFEQHSIKFCLVWPRTAIETVLTLIAEHFEIPVTYPYVSKGEGNLIYWANGPFADGKYHISLYRSDKNLSSQASSTITEPTDRNVLKRRDARHHYTFRGTLTQIKRITYSRTIMRVQNLLSFSWQTLPSGQSYLRRLSDIVRVFWFYRKFQTLCTPSKNIEGPFALFAFQNEPEFAVQGRCRK